MKTWLKTFITLWRMLWNLRQTPGEKGLPGFIYIKKHKNKESNNELLRCRICGYVTEAGKLKDICPGCGLPKTVFVTYVSGKVTVNRLYWLRFDLHPISIHLTQTLAFLLPVLSLIHYFFESFLAPFVKTVLVVSVWSFPFTLLIATLTGLIDGKIRLKTYRAPLLRIKIILSSIILVISVLLLIAANLEDYGILTIILSFLSLFVAVLLGLWGKKIVNIILPDLYIFPKRR